MDKRWVYATVAVHGLALGSYALAEVDRSINNPLDMPNDSPFVPTLVSSVGSTSLTATTVIAGLPVRHDVITDMITGSVFEWPEQVRQESAFVINVRSWSPLATGDEQPVQDVVFLAKVPKITDPRST